MCAHLVILHCYYNHHQNIPFQDRMQGLRHIVHCYSRYYYKTDCGNCKKEHIANREKEKSVRVLDEMQLGRAK